MKGRYLSKWSAEYEALKVTTQATAHGGTVISCALRLVYPSPLVIDGVNSERLENGAEMPKYTSKNVSVIQWLMKD